MVARDQEGAGRNVLDPLDPKPEEQPDQQAQQAEDQAIDEARVLWLGVDQGVKGPQRGLPVLGTPVDAVGLSLEGRSRGPG